MQNEKILVVIPARGGSKRIYKKNIKKICGQPMIFWPLQELSDIFSARQILISTDDDDIIKEVSIKGINVPFKRPKELSDDYTGTMDVANHAFKWFEKNVEKVDFVLIVYPTAVMLDKSDIKSAFNILKNCSKCDYVFSGTKFPFPIQRALFQNKNGYVSMFSPNDYNKRSQDLTEYVHDAGQFYFYKAESLRKSLSSHDSTSKI